MFQETSTHLLTVAHALLFKAQFSLQILDDGVLGSLDVRVGGEAWRLGDRGLPGERFAERRTKQRHPSTLTSRLSRLLFPLWLPLPPSSGSPSGSLTSTLIWTSRATAFRRVSSYLSQLQQECQGERGRAGWSEGLMKTDWQRVDGGMSLMGEEGLIV